MNMLKMALLGGAALAVMASGAQADELADIKARLAQLESRRVAPVDGSLLRISKGATPAWIEANKKQSEKTNDISHLISVVPTADADPGTVITWSGAVRAALTYEDGPDPAGLDERSGINVATRIRIVLAAQTDTAVGAVGVTTEFGANAEGFDISADDKPFKNYWGWWEFSPNWRFGGGFKGTVANVNHGLDENAQIGNTIGHNGGDAEQLRLTYTNGPWEWNLGLEDYEPSDEPSSIDSDAPAGTANINWNNDALAFRLMGGVGSDDNTTALDTAKALDWIVGAGATLGLGDMAVLSVGGALGEGWRTGTNDDFWNASAFLRFDMTEATHVEVGAAYGEVEGDNTMVINGGIYWHPVSQLQLGLQADYTDKDTTGDAIAARFVTWWRF